MRDFFYLSWFYNDEAFHADMHALVKKGEVSERLQSLYSLKKDLIEKGRLDCINGGAQSLVYTDSNYPSCFLNLERPPWVISYRGDISILEEPLKVSIVGSRRADPEVLYWLKENLKTLPPETVLVSGGAIGIDQEVHKIAYRNDRRTVCVSPVGINRIYPSSLKPILNQLLKRPTASLLILSQFYPDQKVFKSSFYPRNYVLSAISEKLIVAQAEKRSGSMVTVKYAIEQGKDIYTLPASPWDLRYSGNLKLLEDGAYQLIDLSLIQI